MLSYNDYVAETQKIRNEYSAALAESSELAHTIKAQFQIARDHRDSSGVSDRYMACFRAFNGEYSPQQLAEIRQFGGSDAFARVTAVKCRALVALLEDIYLGPERPWRVEPTPTPTLPVDVGASIRELVMAEASTAGVTDIMAVRRRTEELFDAAMGAARRKAAKQATSATKQLDDDLVEGDFYRALKDFLDHFAKFPVGILKGPFYKARRRVRYEEGLPVVVVEAMQHFSSPSPFDVWFSPGVSKPEDGDVFERVRLSRQDVEALRRAPGYDADAIDAFLGTHPTGFSLWTSSVEQSRADAEERESPVLNRTGLYDLLEFHGWISGEAAASEPMLADFALEPDKSHHITAYVLDHVVIGVHPNPDPMERPIYHTASFEPVPGSVIGRALPEVLADVQNMTNAALRALINNMAIASGPQVGINSTSIAESENAAELYPWKRWIFTADPAAPSAMPITFFQPSDNSQNLMSVFERALTYADEVSAIPRYAAGGERAGGAARTASGLAMLQGNVSKVVRSISKNIDHGVLESVLKILYDMRLLTDTDGTFTGDETIRALGTLAAEKQDADRMRLLEMLQITSNPIDMQIMGPEGRIMLLTELAQQLGFDHGHLRELLEARLKALAQQGTDPTQAEGQPQNAPAPAATTGRPGEAVEGAVANSPRMG